MLINSLLAGVAFYLETFMTFIDSSDVGSGERDQVTDIMKNLPTMIT